MSDTQIIAEKENFEPPIIEQTQKIYFSKTRKLTINGGNQKNFNKLQ